MKSGGGERAQRRTREEGSKNEFGSQDGQEVPNSRERDRQEDGETGLEAYRREKMNGPERKRGERVSSRVNFSICTADN